MAAALTVEQEQATKSFLDVVNRVRRKRAAGPVAWATAVKFLAARKFDVTRAVALYEQHEATRRREGLPTRDGSGAAIAVFTARMHYPQTSSHQTTLQGGYPAKLKKVLIVTAPLWFKAPFKILRLFVREKLRDRVYTVSIPQLTVHIPRGSLPSHLGGTLDVDHAAWLLHCIKSMTNRHGDLYDVSSPGNADGNIMAALPNGSGNSHQGYSQEELTCGLQASRDPDGPEGRKKARSSSPVSGPEEEEEEDIVITARDLDNGETWQHNSGSGGASSPAPPPSSASSGFSDDDSLHCDVGHGLTLEQFVESVKSRGRAGLVQDYAEIRARPPDGSFNYARLRAHNLKNRYTDVLCYDHSRVLLSQIDGDSCSDYINANFVDGYKQKNAFISTQGPLPNTCGDFWRMVWEQQALVVVMTTRVIERGRTKCAQYWAKDEGGVATHGFFQITTTSVTQHADFTVSNLQLVNIMTEESREVSHYQFTSWPDYGVPHSAMAMLDFLERVRQQQAKMVATLGDTWAGHPRGPPIIVHCSAGIGRTGTFCTLDICISRLEDVRTVDVRGTVERIRSQRAYSIQMPDQYVFCHLALIEYAVAKELISAVDLSGFEDTVDNESD
ncbi:Tyrosine-protein phosphatase Lar [Gryllus bimaculatus]|nr:Tyrosine-protein phosphatase Lar [Gryllus bimaculatus]